MLYRIEVVDEVTSPDPGFRCNQIPTRINPNDRPLVNTLVIKGIYVRQCPGTGVAS